MIKYYWYHFGLDSNTIENIENSIDDGDYKTFKKYQQKYPKNLPANVFIINESETNLLKRYTSAKLDKDTFSIIEEQEHENG